MAAAWRVDMAWPTESLELVLTYAEGLDRGLAAFRDEVWMGLRERLQQDGKKSINMCGRAVAGWAARKVKVGKRWVRALGGRVWDEEGEMSFCGGRVLWVHCIAWMRGVGRAGQGE